MGRSKFPGKPSKLVNKKRVSVLNGALSNPFGDHFIEEEINDVPNERISLNETAAVAAPSTTTTSSIASGHDGDDFQKNTSHKPIPPDPPDKMDTEGNCTSSGNGGIDGGGSGGILTRARKNKPTSPEPPDSKPVKKKTVTFKNVLETSDDVNIVKKVYNPNKLPSVPIIKINKNRQDLSRSERFARGDIVMPSRLTEVLKNYSANSIDKLNLLTFKSGHKSSLGGSSSNGGSGSSDSAVRFKFSDGNNSTIIGGTDTAATMMTSGSGEKRFILPKRSAHSCRVIKPNKKFIDDPIDPSIRLNRKTSGNMKKLGKKSHESKGKDDAGTADGFINNTLSSQIDNSKLSEIDFDGSDASQTMSDENEGSDDNDDQEDNNVNKKSQPSITFNPFASKASLFNPRIEMKTNIGGSAQKTILRQPMLQFSSILGQTTFTNTEGPFSLNLNKSSINNSIPAMLSSANNITCGICGTVSLTKSIQQSRKFGVHSCEACRKFISKTIKKLASNSGSSSVNMLQCNKNDGTCIISPVHKSHCTKPIRSTFKDRCHACWLKKCIKVFQVPSSLRSRIIATLPANMRNVDNENNQILSPFSIKMEKTESTNSNNLFASGTTSTAARLITWSTDPAGDGDLLKHCKSATSTTTTSATMAMSNSLLENNLTFGSSPLIKPTIAEKPIIMAGSGSPPTTALKTQPETVSKQPSESATKETTAETKNANDETGRLRNRRKERDPPNVPPPSLSSSSSVSTPVVESQTTKRQRIDLKGPRVKHVCRSASIVLGQPIALFPQGETPVPENMDTPPRPDTPLTDAIVEMDESTVTAKQQQIVESTSCADCTDENSPLSPPATPIDEESSKSLPEKDTDETSNETDIAVVPSDVLTATDSQESTDISMDVMPVNRSKAEEITKPATRKVTRPTLTTSNILGPHYKKLNAFSSRYERKPAPSPPQRPMISIDFWENYDPAEVCQTGFGLIVSEQVPLRALCFLCGSSGLDELMFCVCCCEPYHQYCVEDEYNLKHTSLDDTNMSLMDSMLLGGSNSITNRLNWMCPRCTVCYTCNMASGSKVKCQKCQKNYHSTCLGTSKRLLGADRPLICANCLKCKSCSTTNVSKFVGNLPMCTGCFKLRQKGNYCPLCQKCYEDNDYNIKMMECGDCKRWVHAKCEGLTDEQYNMLSILPENIEFICKKCAKCNLAADTWREAVAAEFKAGLMTVIRLLSKSRQACALLKLSPRKKQGNCICQPIQSNRTLQFNRLDDFAEDDELQIDTFTGEIKSQIDEQMIKCYCGANQKSNQMQSSPILSLLDIKQKVNANEYYSLADFNYDMNIITNAAGCDELITAYKEILSETFPWFQNETKACTDALEEDMYNSCSFSQNSPNIECDQQVPMIDIPDDVDDLFYSSFSQIDDRICLFCKQSGEGKSLDESRLLYCGQNCWVHTNCAMWSAEVFEEIDGSLQNVHSAISRGRLIKCSKCQNKGATVGCNVRTCGEHYHYACARTAGCAFMIDKTVYCPQHLNEGMRKKCSEEKNFEVCRPVYVELDRKKKKFIDPTKVQFLIGSLKVKQLGKFVRKLSDTLDVIIPADFLCTRLYWSTKEPWKIVEYTVKTSIQNNNISMGYDSGRNFTVDHTTNVNLVQLGLAQISKWHSNLTSSEDMEYVLLKESSVKQLLEAAATSGSNTNDETNEDEPQNNADLLPPEIKDAIFEDLPHDILEGISMLDIFPKLMTYEDLVAMDNKTEAFLTNDLQRDSRDHYNMSDDEDMSEKDYDGGDGGWIGSNMNHVEDALLSAARPNMSSVGRELKRSKSEVFSRNAMSSRGHQRSSSFTWSCKLDPNLSAKRRKMSRFDLRLPDGVLLSLGRRKDDFHPASNISERRRSIVQTDEVKSRNFTWSAAKKISQLDTVEMHDSFVAKDILDKLKISQLDGMDDMSSGSEGNSPTHEYPMNIGYDTNIREATVKCDRCHCTYRNYDSYQRHLTTCEPLSTSESESEATARSPDMQSPPHNVIIASMSGQDFCTVPIMSATQQHQQQSQQIFNINGQQIVQNQPFQTVGGGGNQAMSFQTQIQNSTIPVQQIGQQVQGMIISSPSNGGHQQSQIFSQPIFPMQNLQAAGTTLDIQGKSQHQRLGPNTITLPNGINIQTSQAIIQQQQQQPQIISFSQANNNPQIMTLTTPAQQNLSTFSAGRTIQQSASPLKNQLILPQPQNTHKRQGVQNFYQQTSANVIRTKGRPPNSANKSIQIKRTIAKSADTKPTSIFNQNLPMIRSAGQQDCGGGGNVIIQQTPQSQPIIVQQLAGNQGNIVQYVTDSHNTMQYITMPTSTNDYKHQQTQYLTPNPLVPGTYQIQTADNSNLLLANQSPSIQVLPNGTLQLTQQPQQPQVIGTIIQPQPTAIQCGMMSADQMVLGGNGLEMVTNPSNGCMLLTSQPVYYGLETIVQNTVMSSQQFVSTAMQGVLSQNSSFSATTTQVFQASKIEPIMEVPAGYVVLNNDGTIMQQQTQQPSIIPGTNVMPQITQLSQLQHQPIQTSQAQSHTQQSTPQTWHFVDDKSTIQLLPTTSTHQQQQQQQQPQIQQQQQQHIQNITMHAPQQIQPNPVRHVQSPKPIVKSSPIVMTKIQPHNHQTSSAQHNENKSSPVILPKPQTASLISNNGGHIVIQTSINKQTSQPQNIITVSTPQMSIQPMQRKTNLIKPITKLSSVAVKPKMISKPVMTPKLQNTQSKPPALAKILSITSLPTAANSNETKLAQQLQQQIQQEQIAHQQPALVPLYTQHTQQTVNANLSDLLDPTDDSDQTIASAFNEIANDAECFDQIAASAEDITADNEQQIVDPTIGLNSFMQQTTVATVAAAAATTTTTPVTVLHSTNSFLQPKPGVSSSQFCANINQLSSISLPTSASIQLPIAPYAPPYSNGIPTNVVNPIQQHSSNSNCSTISRPTNRVLPMQTLHQKHSLPQPDTPPLTKRSSSLDQLQKQKPITIETPKVSPILDQEPSPNQLVIIEKDESNETGYPDDDDDDLNMELNKIINIKQPLIDVKSNYQSSTDDVFDKLKCESCVNDCEPPTVVEQRSPEVKDKISDILDNLDSNDCNKGILESALYPLDDEHDDEKSEMAKNKNRLDQKENLNPIMDNGMNVLYQKLIGKDSLLEQKPSGPRMLYEIQSQDGFTYKSTSISEIWEKVFEMVQLARKAHGLAPLPEGPLADMCGPQMLGLKTNALRYLLEQLPGVERCTNYKPRYHKSVPNAQQSAASSSGYSSDLEDLKENPYGAARCEPYYQRSEYDMFSWLASRHRKQPVQIVVPPNTDMELIPRRGTGSNLPMAMRYRTLKETYKDTVGVYRSHIHGRGLFCNRDIEAGEMVIEYAGELIRSTLTDKREKYYDSRGIGCYMFKIDENLVVDATMRGNAARFINHACEPNCYSKVVDILGHKHIIIFALRRIVQGEELTYDYKFPFEETKIPCSCGSKKCRKYLN